MAENRGRASPETDGYPLIELTLSDCAGRIGLAPCPGMRGGVFRPELMRRDLDEAERWGATAVLCLLLPEEIETFSLERLIYEVRRRGIGCIQLEISDEGSSRQIRGMDWQRIRGRLVQALRNGERLLIPCTESRRRTGRVAAWLLRECGVSAGEAIERVRTAFPNAISTEEEEASIRNYVPNG